MKKCYFVLLFVLVLINNSLLFSQNGTLDSLNQLLSKAGDNSTRIDLLIKLGEACEVQDNLRYAEPALTLIDTELKQASDTFGIRKLIEKRSKAVDFITFYYKKSDGNNSPKIIDLYKQHLAISEQYKERFGIVNSIMAMADHFIGLGEPLKRLECLKEGFAIMKKLDFKKGMARIGMQTAFFYADIGDTTEAMNQLQKMQELEMQIGDSTRISRGYYILARFYDGLKKYDLALTNYRKAEARFKITKDTAQLLQIYYELGNTYKNKGEYDKALQQYEICLAMAIKNRNNFQYIGVATVGIGDVHCLKKEYGKAIAMHKEIYDFYNELHFETVIFYVGTHLANDYYLSGQYANAKPIIKKLLSLASSSNYFPDLLECERLTYKIDSATGDYRSSLEHFQKYLAYKNKINTEAVQKASVQEKYQNDLAEQNEKAKRQQESLEAKSKEEKKKQDLILYAVSFVLFFIFIFAILLYRGYRLKQKANKELGVKNETIEAQKHEVEEKQKEILDSIKYAKRIQTALLPSEKYIARKLSGSKQD